MSGKTSIESVALDFITVYKRYKDMKHGAGKIRPKKDLLRRKSRKEKLDIHPC